MCKSGIRLEAPRNIKQNLSQLSLHHGRESNQAPPEYNSKALPVGET